MNFAMPVFCKWYHVSETISCNLILRGQADQVHFQMTNKLDNIIWGCHWTQRFAISGLSKYVSSFLYADIISNAIGASDKQGDYYI